MELSVVIPTCNHPDNLQEALESLLNQILLPKEIIVVDDSPNKKTKQLIDKENKEFDSKGIPLKYIRKDEQSLALSINIGVKKSTGDIVLILDDDVILDRKYIEEIVNVYETRPNTLGVQGNITNNKASRLKNITNKFFFLVHSKPNINQVLPSFQNVYAIPIDKVINCQWMVGNNFSFKKGLFSSFKCDENLEKNSYCHDIDLTYRIYKKFPFALYQTPFAKLVHKGAKGIKLNEEQIYRLYVYRTYLFYKNIPQTIKNKLIFLWSKVGLLVLGIGVTILRLKEARSLKPWFLLGACGFCLTHIREIKQGKLDFFNKM